MEPSLFGRYPVKFAKIDVATNGATAIVSAVTGKHIRLLGYHCVAGGALGIKWQSNSTDLTGLMPLAANGGLSVESAIGICETDSGEALNINLDTNLVQLGGSISYIEVEGPAIVAGDLG